MKKPFYKGEEVKVGQFLDIPDGGIVIGVDTENQLVHLSDVRESWSIGGEHPDADLIEWR